MLSRLRTFNRALVNNTHAQVKAMRTFHFYCCLKKTTKKRVSAFWPTKASFYYVHCISYAYMVGRCFCHADVINVPCNIITIVVVWRSVLYME